MKRKKSRPHDYPTLAEHYKKKYPSHVAVLESSPLQHARKHGITEWDIAAMGMQLDQFKAMCRMHEGASSMANLDKLPQIGLDVISANFGVSPLSFVAGIQPIPDEIGIVWFEDFIAQNTRGNVTAGQSLITSLSAPDVYNVDYSSDTLLTANFLTDGGTVNAGLHLTYTSVALGGTQDLVAPVDPQRCTIYGSAKFNSDADVVTFARMTVDPATGQFSNAQVVNNNLYTVYGVVNFNTGTASVQFNATPSSALSLFADFAVLEEAATDIVSGILQMQHKPVTARFFAMKSTYGLFQQYVAQRRWGMNVQDEMTKKLVQCLNNEVMNIVIKQLIALVPGNATKTWVREPGNGIDYASHKLSLPDAITDTSKLITQNAGRGHASTWMCGLNAASVLEALPGFTKTFDDDTFGPHVYGTYRGNTIVRVPAIAQMDPDLCIGIYKGPTPFEAPIVWAPFMPLTVTDPLIAGVNPMQYQKGAGMSGAIDSMIPNFLCSLRIDQTNFDYASL